MNNLIYGGGAVKATGAGEIAGWLVYFSGPSDPDAVGDFFDPSCDFDLDGVGKSLSGYYHHGLDPDFGLARIGSGWADLRGQGVWLSAKLNLQNSRVARLFEKVRAGKMFFSSGAVSHLVRRQRVGGAHKITSWPLGEWSLTETPASKLARIVTVKSMADADLLRESLKLRAQFNRRRLRDLLREISERRMRQVARDLERYGR